MDCEACRLLFDGEPSTLAARVDAAAQRCACETCSVSPYSPGPVRPNEQLIRFVVDPLHVPNGQIASTLFSDAETTGSSVFRAEETPNRVLLAEATKVVQRSASKTGQPRKIIGVIEAPCEIFQLTGYADEGNVRAFCVYDTARVNCVGHGDVLAALGIHRSKSARGRAREKLRHKLLSYFIPVDQFRGGLLGSLTGTQS
jgi:hypothetical protein